MHTDAHAFNRLSSSQVAARIEPSDFAVVSVLFSLAFSPPFLSLPRQRNAVMFPFIEATQPVAFGTERNSASRLGFRTKLPHTPLTRIEKSPRWLWR
jgi:hypothetical protein